MELMRYNKSLRFCRLSKHAYWVIQVKWTDGWLGYLFFQCPHLLLNYSQSTQKFLIFLTKVKISVVFFWRLQTIHRHILRCSATYSTKYHLSSSVDTTIWWSIIYLLLLILPLIVLVWSTQHSSQHSTHCRCLHHCKC